MVMIDCRTAALGSNITSRIHFSGNELDRMREALA